MAINRLVPADRRRRISYRAFAILAVILGSLAPTVAAGDKSSGGDEHVVPTGLIVVGASPSSVSIAWDDVGNATKYVLSVNGKPLLKTPRPRVTVDRLTCGTAYTFGVATYDDAPPDEQATIVASSSPCEADAAAQGTSETAAPSVAVDSATISSVAGDSVSPTQPRWLTVRTASETSMTVSWQASSDNVGVVGYGVYLNGARVVTTASLGYVYASLTCGTSYTIAVDAYDAAGNRSDKNERTVATDPCSSSAPSPPTTTTPPPPTTDTQPPTMPVGLTRTDSTPTSVTLTWDRSTDNIGVLGYGLYIGTNRVSSSSNTTAFFGALKCGTSVTLGVDAFDAAGNRSARAQLTTSTQACPTSTPPPATSLPTSCDRVASPGEGTANALLGSLTSGQVGCLHGGVYTASSSYVLDFSKSNVTVMAYPGERPVLRGILIVRDGANGVRLANVSVDGSGGSNTIHVYGDDFVLEGSDITNGWRGNSCMILGSSSAGTADRPVIRNNRFHECGNLSRGNQDHGIYAAHVVEGRISNNVFWNTAAYAIQLYPDAQRTTVSHNTIDGGSPSVRGGVIFGGDSNNASTGNTVEYNVIAYAATYDIGSWWGGPVGSGNVARYNCVYGGGAGNIAPENGFVATGNVVANPLFEDRSGGDYELLSTSPCLTLIK